MRIKTVKKVTFYEKTSERGTTVKRGFFFYFAVDFTCKGR